MLGFDGVTKRFGPGAVAALLAPVSVRVNVAATLPALPWVATGLLIAGGMFLLGGALLIVLPIRGASRQRTALISS